MDYSYFTDFGDRKINEDRVGAAFHDEACCFVVADGLGGHGGGETAAQTAVDTVCVQFVENGFHDHFFERAFSAAQEAILQKQERIGAHSQMKTTLVVLVIDRDKAYWAHVGDSRLYFSAEASFARARWITAYRRCWRSPAIYRKRTFVTIRTVVGCCV